MHTIEVTTGTITATTVRIAPLSLAFQKRPLNPILWMHAVHYNPMKMSGILNATEIIDYANQTFEPSAPSCEVSESKLLLNMIAKRFENA